MASEINFYSKLVMWQLKFNYVKISMDICIGQPMSDIHTWIYSWIYPWISISTATLRITDLEAGQQLLMQLYDSSKTWPAIATTSSVTLPTLTFAYDTALPMSRWFIYHSDADRYHAWEAERRNTGLTIDNRALCFQLPAVIQTRPRQDVITSDSVGLH